MMTASIDVIIDPIVYDYPTGLTLTSGTFTFNSSFGGDIIVPSGVDAIVLNSNMLMGSNAKIVVEPGGSLILDNTIIDSFFCDKLWHGIEIRGGYYAGIWNPGYLQTLVSEINHAVISLRNYKADWDDIDSDGNTLEPVPGSGGGEVLCAFTNFFNNQQDAKFLTPGISTFSPIVNFRACLFQIDNDYLTEFPPTAVRAQFDRQPIVHILDCSFINLQGYWPATQSITAVNLVSSGLSMTSATSMSTVSGFTVGVRATTSNPAQPFVISDMQFECYRGVYSTSYGLMNIWRNEFYGLPSAGGFSPLVFPYCDCDFNGGAYGCYLQRGVADVQENIFDMDGYNYNYGLVCNDLGKFNHNIYRNEFFNNRIGLYVWNRNRTSDGLQGLLFECNTFGNNQQDAVIWNPNYPGNIGAGIRELQGEVDLDDPDIHFSATNTFESGNGFSYDDIESTITNYHLYRYADIELDPLEVYDIPDGNLNWELEPVAEGNILACESNFEFQGGGGEEQRMSATESFEEKKTEWLALTDGGDTEDLTEEVILAEYADALALYYELMSKSPALSEEVMIEAIRKEYELPAVLLTLILKSNPRAARSAEIREELDNRMMPLSEYQREQINEALEFFGQKELLEFQMQTLLGERDEAIRQLTREIQNDSTNNNKLNGLIALYEPELVLSDRISKAILYMANGETETAVELLEDADDDFKMKYEDVAEINDLLSLIEITEENAEVLSTQQTSDLEYLLENSEPLPAGIALGLLTEKAGYVYEEPLYLPSTPVELRSTIRLTESSPDISLFPNPVNELLLVSTFEEFYTVEIFDETGRMVLTKLLELPSTETYLKVEPLVPGIYTVRLTCADSKLLSTLMVKE